MLTAIGQRGNDLTNLVSHANTTLGAIASQNQALDQTLVKLPPTLREANTTFVNLRAALDDLDPLVNAAKPATKDLPTFLRNLRPVAERSVPVFTDLATALRKPGKNNDLVAALRGLPKLEKNAATASPHAVAAINASLPTISFARPYSPELAGFITKFGQATSYYDANGHYFRVQPGDTGPLRLQQRHPAARPDPADGRSTGTPDGRLYALPGRRRPSRSRAPTHSSTTAPSSARVTPATCPRGHEARHRNPPRALRPRRARRIRPLRRRRVRLRGPRLLRQRRLRRQRGGRADRRSEGRLRRRRGGLAAGRARSCRRDARPREGA